MAPHETAEPPTHLAARLRDSRAAQALLAHPWLVVGVAQALLGLWLLRAIPAFNKYPLFAELLRTDALGAEQSSAPSPLYLLCNLLWPPWAMRLLHFGAALLALRAVHRIGRAFLGPGAGLAAMLLLAFCRPFLVYQAVLEPDFLLMAALCAGLELALLGEKRFAAIAGGALLGAAVALRPVALPAALVGAALLGARALREKSRFQTLAPAALAFALSAAGPVLCVSAMTGAPPRATMSGMTVLYEGSRPESAGDGAAPPLLLKLLERQLSRDLKLPDLAHVVYRDLARAAEEAPLAVEQCQRFWGGLWRAYAREHPLAFARLQARKLAFALSGSRATDVRAARAAGETQWTHLLSLDARWLSLLALVGLGPFLLLARGARRLALAWAALLASVVAFYVSERYLVALLPFQALFAGALAALPSSPARRRALAAALAGTIAGALLFRADFVQDNERLAERLDAATDRWITMGALRRAHDGAGRLAELPEALADFPAGSWVAAFRMLPFESRPMLERAAQIAEARWGSSTSLDRVFLAQLRAAAGDCDEVERLAASLPIPVYLPSYYDELMDPFAAAARCAMGRRDWPAASGWLSRSLENRPGNRDGLALAFAVAKASGDQQAAALRQGELFRLHDEFSAEWATSKALRAAGLLAEAERTIDRALLTLRGAFVLRFERALILEEEGRWPESAHDFNRALELVPDFNYPVAAFDQGFERLARESADDSEAAMAHIQVLARLGRVSEAIALARAWQARDPLKRFVAMEHSLEPWAGP